MVDLKSKAIARETEIRVRSWSCCQTGRDATSPHHTRPRFATPLAMAAPAYKIDASLREADPEIHDLLEHERARQFRGLGMEIFCIFR
jgi:hypothetical protein